MSTNTSALLYSWGDTYLLEAFIGELLLAELLLTADVDGFLIGMKFELN